MTFTPKVVGGTNAGWRRVSEPGVRRCDCGGFISCARAAAGATQCLRCLALDPEPEPVEAAA